MCDKTIGTNKCVLCVLIQNIPTQVIGIGNALAYVESPRSVGNSFRKHPYSYHFGVPGDTERCVSVPFYALRAAIKDKP